MSYCFKLLALLLVLTSMGAATSRASDKIWVGLYLGENAAPAAGAAIAPEKMHARLHDVFGFKHYELIKGQDVELKHEWEHWFLPRKDFFLRLEPLPQKSGEARIIDYEIYKDGFIVAKGKYEPREGEPLFINGPDFRQGRLIVVLEAK